MLYCCCCFCDFVTQAELFADVIWAVVGDGGCGDGVLWTGKWVEEAGSWLCNRFDEFVFWSFALTGVGCEMGTPENVEQKWDSVSDWRKLFYRSHYHLHQVEVLLKRVCNLCFSDATKKVYKIGKNELGNYKNVNHNQMNEPHQDWESDNTNCWLEFRYFFWQAQLLLMRQQKPSLKGIESACLQRPLLNTRIVKIECQSCQTCQTEEKKKKTFNSSSLGGSDICNMRKSFTRFRWHCCIR